MSKKIVGWIGLLMAGLIIGSCQQSKTHDNELDLEFSNAFVVSPPEGRTFALGGFSAKIAKGEVDLINVSSDIAESVEMHDVTLTDGVMKMRKVDRMAIAEEKPLLLERGGKHLMMFGIRSKLEVGKNLILQMTVEDSQGNNHLFDIEAEVRSADVN